MMTDTFEIDVIICISVFGFLLFFKIMLGMNEYIVLHELYRISRLSRIKKTNVGAFKSFYPLYLCAHYQEKRKIDPIEIVSTNISMNSMNYQIYDTILAKMIVH